MFPIRDHNPSGRTPFVTYALIVANVAIFLSYGGARYTSTPDSVVWGVIPDGMGDWFTSGNLRFGQSWAVDVLGRTCRSTGRKDQ